MKDITDLGVPMATQTRSRKSLERILESTRKLLIQSSGDGFTIADVSASAGVAVGSVYGRVGSKQALIREVHRREMDRIDTETEERFQAVGRPDTFEQAILEIVRTRVDILVDEADILRAFIGIAGRDPEIVRRGQQSGLFAQHLFGDKLRAVCDTFHITVDENDLAWTEELVYGAVFRQLRIGIAAHAGSLAAMPMVETVGRLTRTIGGYLAGSMPHVAPSPQ